MAGAFVWLRAWERLGKAPCLLQLSAEGGGGADSRKLGYLSVSDCDSHPTEASGRELGASSLFVAL